MNKWWCTTSGFKCRSEAASAWRTVAELESASFIVKIYCPCWGNLEDKKRRSAKPVKLPSEYFILGLGVTTSWRHVNQPAKHTHVHTQTHMDNLMCSSFDASAATFNMCDCWFAGGTVSLKSASDSVLFFSCLFLGRFSLGTCLDRQTNRQRAYCFFTI